LLYLRIQRRGHSQLGQIIAVVRRQNTGRDEFVAKKVSGVFFAPLELTPQKDAINRNVAEVFDKAGIPIVLLDRDLVPYPSRSPYDLLGIDNRRAGYTITAHMLRAGCRRVLFF